MNGKWFYIKRGYNDGAGDAAKRTGGSLVKTDTHIALYNKLGDTNSSSFQTAGGVPTTGTGDTFGYSVNGSAVKNTPRGTGTYYTQGTVKTERRSEWDYAYALPLDCLRLLNVGDLDSGRDFVLEKSSNYKAQDLDLGPITSRTILCNISEKINIKYVGNVSFTTSDQDIDPLFSECVSLHVAFKLSELLVKTTSVTQIIGQEYTKALSQAKSVDAQEGSPVNDYHSTWSDEMGRTV